MAASGGIINAGALRPYAHNLTTKLIAKATAAIGITMHVILLVPVVRY